MSMMTSEILKFVDSSIAQKFEYLDNDTFFFFKEKKLFHHTLRGIILQK